METQEYEVEIYITSEDPTDPIAESECEIVDSLGPFRFYAPDEDKAMAEVEKLIDYLPTGRVTFLLDRVG